MTISAKDDVSRSGKPGFASLVSVIILIQIIDALCFPITRYGTLIIEPFTFAFFRFVISSIVLLTVVRFRERKPPIERGDWPKILLLAVLIIPGNQMLYMFGQSMTAAGHGAFLFATSPVWIFLLAIVHLKEKVVAKRVTGIVLSFGGVLIIMLGGQASFGFDYLLGDLIILVAVLAWCYYTIIGKPLVEKYGAFRITAYALATGSAVYFPFGLYRALSFDYTNVTVGAWGAVLFMALGLSVGLYVLWYWLLKHMEASRVAIWYNLFPVISAVVAYFFLGEPLTGAFVVGGVIVLAGVTITEV